MQTYSCRPPVKSDYREIALVESGVLDQRMKDCVIDSNEAIDGLCLRLDCGDQRINASHQPSQPSRMSVLQALVVIRELGGQIRRGSNNKG